MSQEKRWYIISTTGLGSRATLQIQSLLDRLSYPGLLWSPSVKRKVIKHGKEVFDNKPIFSSYTFIQAIIDDSALEQALMESKLGHFLKLPHDESNDLPTPISDEDIEHLRSLEETNVEPIPEEIITIEVGNLVEVCVGPFMGIKGIVTKVNNHDVYVETLVFGRSAPVKFNIAHLSKLTENSDEEKNTEI